MLELTRSEKRSIMVNITIETRVMEPVVACHSAKKGCQNSFDDTQFPQTMFCIPFGKQLWYRNAKCKNLLGRLYMGENAGSSIARLDDWVILIFCGENSPFSTIIIYLSPHVSGLSETMLPRFIAWFIIIFPFRAKSSGYTQFSGTPILSYCLYHVPKINLHRIGEVNCPFIVAELCKIHHFKTQIILSWLYDIPHIPHNPHKHHHFWWFNPSFLLASHLISFIFPIWRIP